jgi:pseudouridine kinase
MGGIAVIGGINADVSGQSRGRLKSGESVPGTIERTIGGAGRNVAANLARLGDSVSLFSRVGADSEGEAAIETTGNAGVDVSFVDRTAARTDAYVSLIDHAGELLGAVADMAAVESVNRGLLEAWTTPLSERELLIVDTNLDGSVIDLALRTAARLGLSSVIQVSSAEKILRVSELSRSADLLICNEGELHALLPAVKRANRGAPLPAALFDRVATRCCITDGPHGVRLIDSEGERRYPACAVNRIVDTTGSGDAFTAGLAHCLNAGQNIADACRYGLGAAAVALQCRGGDITSLTDRAVRDILEEEK